MIEVIIVIMGVVFLVLPIIGDQIGGKFMTYKESFILGNGIALILTVLMLVAIVLIISFDHLVYDGISLSDAAIKVYNEFN